MGAWSLGIDYQDKSPYLPADMERPAVGIVEQHLAVALPLHTRVPRQALWPRLEGWKKHRPAENKGLPQVSNE
jgi:hypothetical protein